jgi:predicted  nucleic acid-binding Zn-ribbon protein
MSDTIDNGSVGGGWTLPPGESHDEYLELSALSVSELLSPEELRHLDRHLRICPSCKEIHAQYQALADLGIPAAVTGVESDRPVHSVTDTELDESEAALFARVDQESLQTSSTLHNRNAPEHHSAPFAGQNGFRQEDSIEIDNGMWRAMWWQFAAAILLVFPLGFSLYRVGLHRGAQQAAAAAPRTHPESAVDHGENRAAQSSAALAAIRDEKAAVAALRAQLSIKTSETDRLKVERAALQQNLASSQSFQEQLQRNADALNHQLATDESDLTALRQRISAAGQLDSENTLRVAALREQIDDLKATISDKDTAIAREQELLDHDRDIRELMGSRDLYVGEVYDVARNGQTEKPFGRVFYTKGKSLIFYAYDLDLQPGIRDSRTFQAWGSRGSDRSGAVSLGIFYEDNAANKCWVLKAENAKALNGIDAVFVTAEPHGGSSHPSGKPLLYAYLNVEPNHP